MGHLTRIANTVVHNLEKGPVHTHISNLITGVWTCLLKHIRICKENHTITPPCWKRCPLKAIALVCWVAELPDDCRGRWETFVDQALAETNHKNTIDLV